MRNRSNQVSLVVAVLLFATGPATAALQTGDITIIGMVSDGNDEWSWVPLVDIVAGEVIYFSDTSYSAGVDSLAPRTEGLVQFTAPTAGVLAGTVITVEELPRGRGRTRLSDRNHAVTSSVTWGNDLTISARGDPWLAFQTDDLSLGLSAPGYVPLFAVTSLTTDWESWTGGASSSASNLYPGLTDGENAVAAGEGAGATDEYDNIRYTGPTSGTKEELLALIADASLWQGTNADPNAGYSTNGVSFFDVSSVIAPPPGGETHQPEPASLLVWSVLAAGGIATWRRRRRQLNGAVRSISKA